MWVRAKQMNVNAFIISGFHDSQKRYAGDVFEISDEEIEVDEVIDGQKTGKKIKRLKFFSPTWMEQLTEEEVADYLSSNKNYAPPVYKRRGSGPRKFNKDANVI